MTIVLVKLVMRMNLKLKAVKRKFWTLKVKKSVSNQIQDSKITKIFSTICWKRPTSRLCIRLFRLWSPTIPRKQLPSPRETKRNIISNSMDLKTTHCLLKKLLEVDQVQKIISSWKKLSKILLENFTRLFILTMENFSSETLEETRELKNNVLKMKWI